MASEEDEKELELKDLIIQTLEANGVLPKLKAQIRASVFSALDESEKSNQPTTENPLIKKLLTTREGRLTLSLVHEFLDACNLDYTIAVFEPEINAQNIEFDERSKIAKSFDIYETDETKVKPLLFEVVKSGLNNTNNNSQATKTVKKPENLEIIAKELSPSAIAEARKKFERYDKDKNGIIDKNEFRDLFVELFPAFNKNMLERYVNDEFSATDKNLSSGIDFEEFKSIYKRWFSLCRSVVLRDTDNDDDRSEKSESQSTSMRSAKNTNNKLIDVNKLPTTMKTSKNDLIDLDEISSSSSSSSLTEKMHQKGILDKPEKSTTPKSAGGSLLDDEDFFSKKPNGNAQDTHRSNSSSSTSTINKGDAKTSLKDAPSLFAKPSSNNQSNLKDIDKKIKGLGIGDYEEDNYDDDFTSGTTPRTQSGYVEKRRIKTRNFAGSDDEIDENISYAEESSKFDEVTVDKSISTIQGNNDADYLEDLSN